jgi:hypothetical protein
MPKPSQIHDQCIAADVVMAWESHLGLLFVGGVGY